MKLEEIHEEIAKDLPINNNDLGNESIKSMKLFVKWRKIYDQEKSIYRKLIREKDSIELEKHEYYSGNAPAQVYKEKPFNKKIRANSEIEKYIRNDSDVLTILNKIDIQEQKIETIEATLKEISSRGYSIKNAIDYIKFVNGGF